MNFEWDDPKALANISKHGVSFREAATVLGDPLSNTFPDTGHSFGEERFITVGQAASGRVLVVAHTDRKENIRIISARPATKREKKYYEENC